jgi:hypothetical protein
MAKSLLSTRSRKIAAVALGLGTVVGLGATAALADTCLPGGAATHCESVPGTGGISRDVPPVANQVLVTAYNAEASAKARAEQAGSTAGELSRTGQVQLPSVGGVHPKPLPGPAPVGDLLRENLSSTGSQAFQYYDHAASVVGDDVSLPSVGGVHPQPLPGPAPVGDEVHEIVGPICGC